MARRQERRAQRAAHNQALFRSVNEGIAALGDDFNDRAPYGRWMCECLRTDCTEFIEMTLAEYQALRAESERFAIAADARHVDPEVEAVIGHGARYWTVANTLARRLDERAA
jgi:hypothetical protein